MYTCSRQACNPLYKSQPLPSVHVHHDYDISAMLGSMRRTVVSRCQEQGNLQRAMQADANTLQDAAADYDPEHDLDMKAAVVTSWPTFSKDKLLEAGLYVVATPIGWVHSSTTASRSCCTATCYDNTVTFRTSQPVAISMVDEQACQHIHEECLHSDHMYMRATETRVAQDQDRSIIICWKQQFG